MSSISVEELLEHSAWLRRLAARLVADPASAEDLVQETYVAALRSPPARGSSPRPWLARVLENLERNARRSRVRRADREQLANEARQHPTPEEIALEAEGQRRVAEAVAKLDEPQRTIVVLRYFRGLSSTEIGRLRGASASTVRGQLRQALDQLRSRLDREHGGRAAWAPLLARNLPTAAPTSTTALAMGPSLFSRYALVLAGSLILPFIALFVYLRPTTPSTSAPQLEPSSVSLTGPATPAPAPPAVMNAALASRPASSAALAASSSEQVSLRGRFVLPDGTPVVGLDVHVWGIPASSSRVALHGLPQEWVAPSPVTDAEGRFETSFEAPRAYQFGLRAQQPGYAEDNWRWVELTPGTELDLGSVTLRRGGALEGTLVRADGSPLSGESWRVRCAELALPGSAGRTHATASADVDRETGSFRLEDLPPGELEVRAFSPIAGWISGPRVLVLAEETVVTRIEYAGADNARRIVVTTRNELMAPLGSPAEGSITLVDASGELQAATYIDGTVDMYAFDDLEPGSYAIQISDPRFLGWSEPSALTGTRVPASLVGSCTLVLSVEDADGTPVEPLALRVECLEVVHVVPGGPTQDEPPLVSSSFLPNTFNIPASDEHLSGGRLIGLLPGSYRVRVDGGQAGTRTVEVRDLAPGEQRTLELSLASAAGSGVSGIVRHADGSPAAEVEVLLLRTAEEQDSAASPVLHEGQAAWPDSTYRKTLARTASDSQGAFAFDSPGVGSFALQAREGPLLAVASDGFALQDGEPRTDFELILPAEAELSGRIVGPAGCSLEGLRFLVVPSGLSSSSMEFGEFEMRSTRLLQTDGSFLCEGLTSGTVMAYLKLPAQPAPPGRRGTSSMTFGFPGEGGDGEVPNARALAELVLQPGPNEHEFQVLADFPGAVEVSVTSAGEPLAKVQVTLSRATSPASRSGRKGYTNSAGGPARIVDFPGPRSLEVSDLAQGWRYRSPAEVYIASNETLQVPIEVQLASAGLTLVDATGAARGGCAVQLTFAEGGRDSWVGPVRTADVNGTLELTLVPGEYRCYLLAEDASDQAALRAGRRSMFSDEESLPRASFGWSASGAQVGL